MRMLVVERRFIAGRRADARCSAAAGRGRSVRTGIQADNALRTRTYELEVVLDIGLPDIDGFEVLRRLRARRSPATVAGADRARCGRDQGSRPDLGATDYLTEAVLGHRVRGSRSGSVASVVGSAGPISVRGLTIDVDAKAREGERMFRSS